MRKGLRAIMAAAAGIVLLIMPLSAQAQTENTLISSRFQGDIQFFVDITSFKYPSDPSRGSFVEIYYAMDRSQMEFIQLPDNPGIYSSAWSIQTVIETEVGDRVDWNIWQKTSADTSRAGAEATRDVYDIYWPPPLLQPGVYKFITTVTDLNSQMSGNVKIGVDERLVVIPDYTSDELTLSDVEFAVRLGKASSQNEFTKNGLQVIPNPLRVYGVNVPLLSLYVEVYGLTPTPAGSTQPNTYTRHVSVEGLNVDYRREIDSSTRPVRSGNEIIGLTGINTAILPRGDYRLVVEVVDDATGERALRAKAFRVLTEVAATEADELETATMSDVNIQRYRDQITYLATAEELADYDRRPPEGKREFLIAFWIRHDQTPGTPKNEFREEYMKRFQYANDNFATRTQPAGWKTDQGRIWILYGRPDDIIPHPEQTQGGSPWVEWIYNQVQDIGRGRFIFADTSGGFGSYKLIHSNVPGEIQNPNWKEDLGVTDPNIPPR